MKLFLVALAIGASLCLVAASIPAQDEFAPSPIFQTAKNLAMGARPDVNGNYWNSVKKTINGQEVTYVVGWMPEPKLIAGLCIVGNRRGIVVFNCTDGHYEVGLYEGDKLMGNKVISKEDADSLMKEVVESVGMKGAISY